MGWVYWVMGQPQKAAHMAEQLQLVAPVGSLPRGFYDALMADLALDEGRMKEAQSLYDQARFIALLTGDPGLIALVWLGLSRLNRHLGRVSEAWNWADEVLSLAERVRYVHLAGMALLERARASWAAERMDASESDLKQAIALMDPLRFEYHLAQAWLLLAGLRQHMGRDSMEAWKQASMRIRRGRYAFLLEQERHLALPLIMRYRQEKDVDARHEAADMLRRLTTAAPPPLRIHSLGRFEVWQGPRRIADSAWNRRQAGALFRMLLISPWRTRTREQIIEALWPDLAIQTAYLSLHQATSALRRTLEPDLPRGFPSRYLEVASDCVTLHLPAGSWVEHEAFVALVQQEQWDEALTLYRGKLYPMEPYAEWAAWERERLSRYFLRALLGAAREALSQSRPDDALILARQALLLEPWQEQATRLGMEACLEMGDRAGALRLYQSLAKRLQDELSIVPGEELQALYHRLATE
jgi:DNA-binding SARP family transcriptional activator